MNSNKNQQAEKPHDDNYVSAQKELTELHSKLNIIHSKVEDGRISTRAEFSKEIQSIIEETIWYH